MYNLINLFYFDDKNINGVRILRKFGVLRSDTFSSKQLLKILGLRSKSYIKGTDDFYLIGKTRNGKRLFERKSNQKSLIIYNNELIKVIEECDDSIYFEIFSPVDDVEFLLEKEEGINLKEITVLQKTAIPTSDFPLETYDMFYKSIHSLEYYSNDGDIELFLQNESNVDLNTYFNSFEYSKWREKTGINNLWLSFVGKGDFVVRVKLITDEGMFTLNVKRCTSYEYYNYNIKIIGDENVKDTNVIVGVEFYSLKESSIKNINWITDEKLHTGIDSLAICVTSYNEPNTLNNLIRLNSELKKNCKDLNFRFFLIDNSGQYRESKNEYITIVDNKNFGGTGGFTRGLIEAKKAKYKVCMFMDDDAFCSPFSIHKAFNFIRYTKKDTETVSGAMCDKRNMINQLEAGAWFYRGCHPLHTNLNTLNPYNLFINIYKDGSSQIPYSYGSWWFFMFKINNNLQYPFPFFVRGDDIDFSIKNKFSINVLNGVCSWQDNFIVKESPTSVFLFIRSHVLHHMTCIEENDYIDSIIGITDSHIERYLKIYRYDLALAVILAVDFVLMGAKYWEDKLLLGDFLKKMNESIKNFSKVVCVDIGSLRNKDDFYKKLKLWPITRITKKYTVNSILLPGFIKSNKNWVINDQYIDPAFLFMKNKYVVNEGRTSKLYKYSFYKTISLFFRYMNIKKKFIRKSNELKTEFMESYNCWKNEDKWKNTFDVV